MAGTQAHPRALCPQWLRSRAAKLPAVAVCADSLHQRRRPRASEATGMQAAPMSRGGADDEYTSTASHRSPSSHPRAAGMVGCMSSSGRARRAAEQQQWLRELEGARSLLCQSSSRMLLNSRNAGEHQLLLSSPPAAESSPSRRRRRAPVAEFSSFDPAYPVKYGR